MLDKNAPEKTYFDLLRKHKNRNKRVRQPLTDDERVARRNANVGISYIPHSIRVSKTNTWQCSDCKVQVPLTNRTLEHTVGCSQVPLMYRGKKNAQFSVLTGRPFEWYHVYKAPGADLWLKKLRTGEQVAFDEIVLT